MLPVVVRPTSTVGFSAANTLEVQWRDCIYNKTSCNSYIDPKMLVGAFAFWEQGTAGWLAPIQGPVKPHHMKGCELKTELVAERMRSSLY